MKRLSISTLPLLLFHVVFIWIAVTNFPLNQYFLGWDALSPELNFKLNFARAFAASWQENYGLGVVAGHGFAATLPHTIITYLFSFVMPEWAIRTAFTLFCLYVGGLGMYVLVKRLIKHYVGHEQSNFQAACVGLASALFYMLNLGTIQIFYVQLETFIGHYAFLPWLFLIALLLFEKITPKRLLLFFVINFLATLQGFIPSLFVAYVVALVVFLTVLCVQKKSFASNVKRALLILFLTAAVNSYWVLPLVYYQLTQNTVFLNSYNNLISTPHFIDINKKYGDLANVALIRGYLFDSYQLGDFILRPFITNFEKTVPVAIYLFSFAVIVLGVVMSIIRRPSRAVIGFTFVFLVFFASLSTNIFPFTIVTGILQELSPTYEQAFRTAFTKFSIGVSFSYSIFFGLGLYYLTTFFKSLHGVKRSSLIFWAVMYASIIYAAFPVFRGNLMYDKLFVTPPRQYKEVIEYFKEQPDGRIADLPQECSEGWFAYKWGYFGSGFYWYGVKQPILARSFDVWGKYNENYYWELTQALRSQDFKRVEGVLTKYDVRWVLFDPNAYYCGNQAGTLLQEKFIESLTSSSSTYKKVREFTSEVGSPITLFERTGQFETAFVSEATALPNVGPQYNFEDADEALETTYKTTDTVPFTSFTPFRSLFTKRSSTEREFELVSTPESLIFEQQLPQGLSGYSVPLRALVKGEKTLPIELSFTSQGQNSLATLTIVFPKVQLDGQELYQARYTMPLGTIATTPLSSLVVSINGTEVKPAQNVYKSSFFTQIPNTISIKTRSGATLLSFASTSETVNRAYEQIPETVQIPEYQDGALTVEIPKISDQKLFGITQIQRQNLVPKSCNERTPSKKNKYEISGPQSDTVVRMTSMQSSQCLVYTIPDALTSEGYIAEITTQHLSGNALRFSLVDSSDAILIDQYFPQDIGRLTTQILIPPTNPFGIGYKMTLQNASESDTESINDVYRVNMWQIPYSFLSGLTLKSPSEVQQGVLKQPRTVLHPNETLYIVSPQSGSKELILWQAFNNGWAAYEASSTGFFARTFPFIFGKKLEGHVIINNWANGWTLSDPSKQVIIVFLPQYLQYVGWVLFGGAIAVAILVGRRTISQNRKQYDHPQSS